MKFRNLRITVSVLSAVASLLLFPFWVRSFDRVDIIRGFGLEIRSGLGVLMVLGRDSVAGVRLISQDVEDWTRNHRNFESSHAFRGGGRFGNHFWIAIPYWFLVAVSTTCATIAAAPWLGWRFSLRILLMAGMLIAIAMGFSAYALRK